MSTPTNTDHYDLDTMLEHYIACALWSSIHFEDEDDQGTPFDEVDAELSEKAREEMKTDCRNFLAYLDEEGIDATEHWTAEQLGHDFWLTRNGHGTGFWDRGHGDLGDQLTKAARTYGSQDLYLGDDGEIHT